MSSMALVDTIEPLYREIYLSIGELFQ